MKYRQDLIYPLVSIIIVNYNAKVYLKSCLDSVFNATYPSFEVIVVDNGSSDGSVKYIKKVFGVTKPLKIIQNKENLGPAFARNIGMKIAQGKYIAFLDNDTEPEPEWLGEPIKIMENDQTIGTCQCKILLMNDPKRFDCAGHYLSRYGFLVPRVTWGEIDEGQVDSIEEVLSAKSAAMIIRHSTLIDIGYFDEDYFIYVEETDLCWRAWLINYRTVFVPKSRVCHASGKAAKMSSGRHHYLLKFHGTKNYITTLIKNLDKKNLLKILPVHIIVWIAVATWFCIKHQPNDAKFIMQGIFWNLRNFKQILKKRKIIQSRRAISDNELMSRVMKKQKLSSLYRGWSAARKIGDVNGWWPLNEKDKRKQILEYQIKRFNNQYSKFQQYKLENWRISYLQNIFDGLKLNPATLTAEDTFFDIGVGGSGYTVIEAAKEGCRAVGIDLSKEGIKKAGIFANNNLNRNAVELVAFCISTADDLPFKDSSFTKVASIHVLEHVQDDIKVIDEIARVTKHGGMIFIDVPNTYEKLPILYKILGKIDDKIAGHLRHYKAEDLIKEFQKRGFVLENLHYHAHCIKVLQYILCLVFRPLKYYKNSKLWWRLEEMDLKQKTCDKGFSFFITMVKK